MTANSVVCGNFVEALSKGLAPRDIRVNSVSPGPMLTGLWTEEGG
jgi:NAD(P)-dependent dehydrogenase (short-subunit alcohol dehydrogenase family)